MQNYWHYKYLIGVVAVATGLVAAIVAWQLPPKYEATVSFTITRESAQKTPDYQYDGYYAIQAEQLFGETVMSWFLTTPVVKEVYADAGVVVAEDDLPSVVSHFKVKQYSAQNIVLRVTDKNREQVAKIAAAASSLAEKKAADLRSGENDQAVFAVRGSDPVIVSKKVTPLLAGVVGIVVGLLLAAAGAGLKISL